MNRKILCILTVLALFATGLFAAGATEDGIYNGVTNVPFRPTLTADSATLENILYYNPAQLATNNLIIEAPTASFSGFNCAKAMKSKSVQEAVNQLKQFKFTKKNLITVFAGYVYNVGTGRNDVSAVDAGLGTAIKNFAFGLNVKAAAKTLPDGSPTQSLTTTIMVPVVDAAFSFAYGWRVWEKEDRYLDAGISMKYARKMYILGLNASNLLENADFENKPANAGIAFPFDLGLTYGMLDGKLTFSATALNLNGYYYMHKYANYKDAIKLKDGLNGYVLYSPWEGNLEARFTPKWQYVNPTVSLRFDNINGFIVDDLNTDNGRKPWRELFRHLVLKAELDILKYAKLDLAFLHGYPEFGAVVDIFGNSLEIRYGYHEAGTLYGAKPVDTFTIRIKLGYTPH